MNAKGANDPMKRIVTIQEMMRSTQANSPTSKKNIRLSELRNYRNKSVNVSNRANNIHSSTSSPMKNNDYEAPPVSQQILNKLAKVNLNGYNYNDPGSLTMAYRVP